MKNNLEIIFKAKSDLIADRIWQKISTNLKWKWYLVTINADILRILKYKGKNLKFKYLVMLQTYK